MLIIMEHRDIEPFPQTLFHHEAFGCCDVFKVNRSECRGDVGYRLNERFGTGGGDLDVEHVDIGKPFEQYGLAFHDRFTRQGAHIAQAEDCAAIGDDPDQITLVGKPVGIFGVLVDFTDGFRYARGVCQGQVPGG